jgi:pilus assembly protein CpaB
VRASTVVMIVLAGVFGLLAVFVAQAWMNRQDEQMRLKSALNQPKSEATRMVVVAASPLRFGNPLTSGNLRVIAWPEGSLPEGSFSSIQDVLAAGNRIVLSPIEPNEPVLGSKLTGPGQRATLSAVLHEGMKAVTVRVSDVEGVAGFILPGDRVDILLTRRVDKAGTTDVVLQNTRVLAIDQLADERADKPAVVKAVTVEVDTLSAQKLTLASQVGTLALALRKAGEATAGDQRRVSIEDLGRDTTPAIGPKRFSTVTVVRAGKKEEYGVPSESGEVLETAETGRASKQR